VPVRPQEAREPGGPGLLHRGQRRERRERRERRGAGLVLEPFSVEALQRQSLAHRLQRLPQRLSRSQEVAEALVRWGVADHVRLSGTTDMTPEVWVRRGEEVRT
jgi:hypothetical protein